MTLNIQRQLYLAKGDIAGLSVFFKKSSAADVSENICVLERVNRSYLILNVFFISQANLSVHIMLHTFTFHSGHVQEVSFEYSKIQFERIHIQVYPFPHIDAFLCLCSRHLLEIIVSIREIAQNKKFLILPHSFQPFSVSDTFIYRDFPCFCLDVFKVVCCRFAVHEKRV